MLKLEADSIDAIDEPLRGLYEEKDGKFRLKVDGLPDVDGLRRKNAELMDELKGHKRKSGEIEAEAERVKQEALAKSGDVDALRKSYETKMAAREQELTGKLSEFERHVQSLTVGQTATSIASAIAVQGSADVLLPHIRSRLSVEYRDGQPVTVVLDASGKPSAMTVDELKAEFLANPAFAPIVAGSKAAGGGASGGSKGGGAAGKTLTRQQFASMNAAQKAAHFKEGGTLTD